MNNPIVSICCLTYNHEKYIRQCFDGFIMQKTNFDFEILVHDDASTDGTIDIINEYTKQYNKLFKPYIEKENTYSKKNEFVGLRINFERAKGKYIALCEGDDYWTDPYKLQKQVDFLEANSDYSFVYTSFNVVNSNSQKITINELENYKHGVNGDFAFFNLLIKSNYILTLTTMFRSIYLRCEPFYYDYGIFLNACRCGKAYYMDSITGCYRINPSSVMQTVPNSLLNKYFKILYDQLSLILNPNSDTAIGIRQDKHFKDYVGYALARNIFCSHIKFKTFLLLLSKPYLYISVIKSIFMRKRISNQFYIK